MDEDTHKRWYPLHLRFALMRKVQPRPILANKASFVTKSLCRYTE